ncbi:MAG: hypothetical protein ACOX47_02745 [Bacillota bacterium]|jgi:NAD-dependent SIR2 family protein deacetylase
MRKVFFLGAGASREAGIPTQEELWEQIQERFIQTGDLSIKKVLDFAAYLNFAKFNTKLHINTAELLTLIDIALEQNVSLGRYRGDDLRKIRDILVSVMCEILEMAVYEGYNGVLTEFCERLTGEDSVISLNYDTVIDHILMGCKGEIDYGFSFDYCFGETQLREGGERQLLLKPHGSLNWRYCSRCNHIYLLPDKRSRNSSHNITCPSDEHPLGEVIVTPTYHKKFLVPQLHNVWMLSFEKIKEADVINFVGYSFPPGDMHIIHLIKRAVLAGKKIPEINVISPDIHGMVFQRCKNIFFEFNFYKTAFRDYFYDKI